MTNCLWGMKTENDKVLIEPKYFTQSEIEHMEFEARCLYSYFFVNSEAGRPNWTVVKKIEVE